MHWILAYDQWVLDRAEVLVTWIYEWLSVSQLQLEQLVIVLWAILTLYRDTVLHPPSGLYLCMDVWVIFSLWSIHRVPIATRKASSRRPLTIFVRVILQVLLAIDLLISGVEWLFTGFVPWNSLGTETLLTMIFILLSTGSNGERGRRRALALSKLKELFGTEWIPRPSPTT